VSDLFFIMSNVIMLSVVMLGVVAPRITIVKAFMVGGQAGEKERDVGAQIYRLLNVNFLEAPCCCCCQ
jgi:hypothetical protein